ncbi:MAG: UDP-3-O-[3-hydroxymyristoyl] N-acetylglucosamine deacetylase [Elusimicrobia bacterium]|nr:UDP-3-O-[3-hydroxymyristoyl] N-acetylglucosamine deacetylase [Elusimicrobiota bacterium]
MKKPNFQASGFGLRSFQTTIGEEVSLEGVGLHGGTKVRLAFRPAPANVGIRFLRVDLPGQPMIPANIDFISTTLRGTTLELGEVKVHTVEHLLSAAAGLGIDNLDIALDAGEPPAMDGSALPFTQALLKAGLREWKDHPRRYLQFMEEVRYESENSLYRISPASRFEICVVYQNAHPLVGSQRFETVPDPDRYLSEVAAARTFCFEEEIPWLRNQGLGRGGSLDNTVVIGKDKIQCRPQGLRFSNEFVRHKLLDLMGDLALLGRGFRAVRLEATRPGHKHNIAFAKMLAAAAQKARAVAVKN